MNTTIFDLDGVLSRTDTLAVVLIRLLRGRPTSTLRALPILLKATISSPSGTTRSSANRQLVASILLGIDRTEYERAVETVALELASKPGNISDHARAAVRAAGEYGRVIVSTATDDLLAKTFLKEAGFGSLEVFASHLVFEPTPKLSFHNVGEAKAIGLKHAGVPLENSVFYTDSASDLPLASSTSRTVLVNPSGRSRSAFHKSGVLFQEVSW